MATTFRRIKIQATVETAPLLLTEQGSPQRSTNSATG